MLYNIKCRLINDNIQDFFLIGGIFFWIFEVKFPSKFSKKIPSFKTFLELGFNKSKLTCLKLSTLQNCRHLIWTLIIAVYISCNFRDQNLLIISIKLHKPLKHNFHFLVHFSLFSAFLIFYFPQVLFCFHPFFPLDHSHRCCYTMQIFTHTWFKCMRELSTNAKQKMTKKYFFTLCWFLFSQIHQTKKNNLFISTYFNVIECYKCKIKYSAHDQFVAPHTQFHTKFNFVLFICCHMPNSLTDDFQLMTWSENV